MDMLLKEKILESFCLILVKNVIFQYYYYCLIVKLDEYELTNLIVNMNKY